MGNSFAFPTHLSPADALASLSRTACTIPPSSHSIKSPSRIRITKSAVPASYVYVCVHRVGILYRKHDAVVIGGGGTVSSSSSSSSVLSVGLGPASPSARRPAPGLVVAAVPVLCGGGVGNDDEFSRVITAAETGRCSAAAAERI